MLGETIAPFSSAFSLSSKQQFDSSDYTLKRLDVIANASYGGFTTSVDYGRYAAQPLLGWPYPREGVVTNASYKFARQLDDRRQRRCSTCRAIITTRRDRRRRSSIPPTTASASATPTTCTTLNVRYSVATLSDPIASTAGDARPVAPAVQLDLADAGRHRRQHRPAMTCRAFRRSASVTASSPRPPLAITMGDPAGIGPETRAARLARARDARRAVFRARRSGALAEAGAPPRLRAAPIAEVAPAEAAAAFAGALPVVALDGAGRRAPGEPDPAFAAATIELIERAVAAGPRRGGARRRHQPDRQGDALRGRLSLSRPHRISRRARRAPWGAAAHPVMMIWSPALAVVPVTIHVALARASRAR